VGGMGWVLEGLFFEVNDCFVFEYFWFEFLLWLFVVEMEFFKYIFILDWMSGGLCDVVFEIVGFGNMFEVFVWVNGFVVLFD